MKKYKLLKDFCTPLFTIEAGTIKTEDEWKGYLNYVAVYSIGIWFEWFEEIKEEPKIKSYSAAVVYPIEDNGNLWRNVPSENYNLNVSNRLTDNAYKDATAIEYAKQRAFAQKPKFLPKNGNWYYMPHTHVSKEPMIVYAKWTGDLVDWILYWNGMTFETSEQCQAWMDQYAKYYILNEIE